MGNHDAGRAMVQTATALWDQREKTGQTALEILDIACEPYRGCDAEFDDEARPGEVFGNILTEAFRPGFVEPPGSDGEELIPVDAAGPDVGTVSTAAATAWSRQRPHVLHDVARCAEHRQDLVARLPASARRSGIRRPADGRVGGPISAATGRPR